MSVRGPVASLTVCSGAMYSSVPTVTPIAVSPLWPCRRARPKSTILSAYGRPRSPIRKMLSGLTSRWMAPAACAAASADGDVARDPERSFDFEPQLSA